MPSSSESYTPTLPMSERETAIVDQLNYTSHELVNAIGGLLLERSGQPVTVKELTFRFCGRLVPEKVFRTTVADYCSERLEPAGVATSRKGMDREGKVVYAWQADPEFLETKRALAGLVSSWSLDHPDLSLQQLFGRRPSVGDKQKRGVRQPPEKRTVETLEPRTRRTIYTALLSNNEGLPLTKLTAAVAGDKYMRADWQRIYSFVERLIHRGILEKTVTPRASRSLIFTITRTAFHHRYLELKDTLPETQALYAVLGELGIGTVVSTEELIAEAQRVNPSICPRDLRTALNEKTTKDSRFPGLVVVDKPELTDPGGYSITLSAAVRQPIAELTEGIASITDLGNKDAINHYAKLNKTIVEDPQACIALHRKSRQFSHADSPGGKAGGLQRIEDALSGSGLADVEVIHAALVEQGSAPTINYVKILLSELAAAGKVTIQDEPIAPGSKVRRKLYTLAPPPSPDTPQ